MKKITAIALILAAALYLFMSDGILTPTERKDLKEKFKQHSVVLVGEVLPDHNKSMLSGQLKILEIFKNEQKQSLKTGTNINIRIEAFAPTAPYRKDRFIFLQSKYVGERVLFFGRLDKKTGSLVAYTGYMISDDINSGIDHIDEVEKKYGIEVKRELPFGAKSELAYLRKLAKDKRREEAP
tara:strand:+ start:4727 stop:5272 length:546 start_codon:yes stop_codon:yes gene_type:complete